MAHFAKIENGIVTQVTVISNCAVGSCIGKDHWDYQEEYHKEHGNLNFPDTEPLGQAVLAESGFEGTWIQTSYNANFRGKYAGTGDLWDGTNFTTPTTEGSN
jgi:hypothetical protein